MSSQASNMGMPGCCEGSVPFSGNVSNGWQQVGSTYQLIAVWFFQFSVRSLHVLGDMEVAAFHKSSKDGQFGTGALGEVLQGPTWQHPAGGRGRILLCQVQQEGALTCKLNTCRTANTLSHT